MADLDMFDYATLSPDVAEMVQEHTGEIRTLARRTAQGIVEIGERLLEVKGVLGHGKFGRWLETEFSWSSSAASKFMQVAEQFRSVNFTNLDIAPSALYLLASGSTPPQVREELAEMAQATGQPLTRKAVQERLQAHFEDAPAPPAEEPDLAVPVPEPAPALAALDNAPMAPKKKGEGKAPTTYTPLQYDIQDEENAHGELVKTVSLPDVPRVKEIKAKDYDKAADRFENAAAATLTYLGKIAAYTPEQLREIAQSPEGKGRGTAVRVDQLRRRMQEALALLDALSPPEQGTQMLLPPVRPEDDRTLEMN